MREYEVVYIFRSDREPEEVDELLEQFHGRLSDAEVTAVEHWGKRRLAYEIGGESNGYYVVAQFRADPGGLSDFERGLKHEEALLRHLMVISEGEMPLPPSMQPEEEEEEEEKEEEGEEEEADGDEEEDEEAEDEPDGEADADDSGDADEEEE